MVDDCRREEAHQKFFEQMMRSCKYKFYMEKRKMRSKNKEEKEKKEIVFPVLLKLM